MKVAGGQVGQFRKGMNCLRASLRGREELTARVQAGVGAGDQERSGDDRGYRGRGARSHAAEQSAKQRVHAEAGQLRKVLSPA